MDVWVGVLGSGDGDRAVDETLIRLAVAIGSGVQQARSEVFCHVQLVIDAYGNPGNQRARQNLQRSKSI